jgi:hypothetical protein
MQGFEQFLRFREKLAQRVVFATLGHLRL